MKILVTGATGFIGTLLCNELLQHGYDVNILTLSKDKNSNQPNNIREYHWNPAKNEIDQNCIKDVDAIVNLAGYTINCKWNSENKRKILESRLDCSDTLYNLLKSTNHKVKHIISASAIGIYKSDQYETYDETNFKVGDDFLAEVCKQWEAANNRFAELGIATTITRFGLVLSKDHGVLNELAKVVKLGLGTNLGNGKQWMSWIHYQDVINGIIHLLKNRNEGTYNFVAPIAVQQNEFLLKLAKQLNQKLRLPNIPSLLINIGMGERASLVLSSQRVVPKKLLESNFKFNYINLKDALQNIYAK